MSTASVIRVKRSSGTGAPSTLYTGELAYSVGGGKFWVGGLGTGSDLNGSDGSPILIGGNNFSFLDGVTAGTLTASKALVVDSNSKIDILNVDNVRIDLNTISTTNSNGNLTLAPDGTGSVFVDAATLRVGDNNANATITTNGTGDLILSTNDGNSSGTITILDGAGQNIKLEPNGTGSVELYTSTESWTIPKRSSTVGYVLTAGSNGTTSWAATTVGLTIKGDGVTTDIVTLPTDTLNILGGTGLTSTVTDNTITIDIDSTVVTTSGAQNITDKTFGNGNTWQGNVVAVAYGGTGTSNGSITGTGALTFTAGGTDTNVNLVPVGTGTVDVASKRITSVATPTQSTDAANKAYVDAVKTGLDVKDSVRAATTVELTATYNNTNGTLTNTGTQAAFAVDTVTLTLGQRVLVKDQTTNPFQNGIYTVTIEGDGGTNWELTRAEDFDSAAEITGGAFTFVEEGGTNADSGWVLTTNGTVTVGTTGLTWAQFSGAGQITAGDGLLKTGNTLDVRVDNSTIEINSDILRVKDAGVTFAKIQNVDALSVVGRASNTAGVADEITATAAYQVLRASTDGTTIGFGAITLSQSNAVTGTLAVGNGGTGLSTLTQNGVFYASDTSTVAQTAAGTNGYVLYSNNGTPEWTNIIDGGTFTGV